MSNDIDSPDYHDTNQTYTGREEETFEEGLIRELEAKVNRLHLQRDKMKAALERIGTGWKYPLEHLNEIIAEALKE